MSKEQQCMLTTIYQHLHDVINSDIHDAVDKPYSI